MRLKIGAIRLPGQVNREKLLEELTAALEEIGYEVTDVGFVRETGGFDLAARNDLLTTKDVRRLERVLKGYGLSTGLGDDQVRIAVLSE